MAAEGEYTFRLPEGFTIERVAGPPAIQFPMFAALDDRGRLFVAESSGLDLYDALQKLTRKCRIARADGTVVTGTTGILFRCRSDGTHPKFSRTVSPIWSRSGSGRQERSWSRTRGPFFWCLVLVFGMAVAESSGQTPSAVAEVPCTWQRWEHVLTSTRHYSNPYPGTQPLGPRTKL